MKLFRPKDESPSPSSFSQPLARPDEMAAVLAASQTVNSALGLEPALQVLLASARDLTGAHEGSVMLLMPDGFLVIVAAQGIPPEIAATARIPLGQGVAGRVASTGQPVLLNQSPTDRSFESNVPETRQLRSAVSVPLKAAGRTLGVLNLNLVHGSSEFSEKELRLAMIFGEQAAMAIHKAQLLQHAQERGDQLSTLLDAGRGLMGILDLDPLLDRIVDGSIRMVSGRAGFAVIIDPTGPVPQPACHALVRADVRQALSDPMLIDAIGVDGSRVEEPWDTSPLSAFKWANERALIVSTRLEGTTRLSVVIFTAHSEPERISLLQTFVAQSVLAVRNAQLYGQVEATQSQLSSVVYSMTQPVLVVDPAGRLTLANPAAEELFGFVVDFAKGQPVGDLLNHPELEAMLAEHRSPSIEVSAGSPVPRRWKATVSTVLSADSKGERVMVLHDVTSEREAEQLQADFVAVVGHELRTPLTLVKGFVKTLIHRGEKMTPEMQKEALMSIDAQSHRLERLIEDLLYVSRIEKSRPPLHLEQVDVAGTVRDMATEFKKREPNRQFLLTAPNSLGLMVDKTKLEQILYHLIDNACKYSKVDTTVEIHLSETDAMVEFEVSDKGIGILSSDIPHLFDRFHQVDGTSTRAFGGTGVGLFVCKSLVEAHEGSISVDSVWGKGSTFRFSIPKRLESNAQEISIQV